PSRAPPESLPPCERASIAASRAEVDGAPDAPLVDASGGGRGETLPPAPPVSDEGAPPLPPRAGAASRPPSAGATGEFDEQACKRQTHAGTTMLAQGDGRAVFGIRPHDINSVAWRPTRKTRALVRPVARAMESPALTQVGAGDSDSPLNGRALQRAVPH